jgi:outer membrane receptor protein involved in Fe transport
MSDQKIEFMTSTHSLRRGLLNSVFAGICVSAAFSVAHAQEPAPAPASTASVDEVVVTGSRVGRSNYTAPTPVTTIGPQEMSAEAPSNIADFARSFPTLQGGSSASTRSNFVSDGRGGISSMDLRSLGAPRTLVLLDGLRSPPADSVGDVDVNTFPQSLIERIEIVTGGASAQYGSDAVGGVVNFILNKRYTGLKGEVEYGETTYGDGIDKRASLTFGAPFAKGRGHVLMSGEYAIQDGVHTDTHGRAWTEQRHFGMLNSAANIAAGQPSYLVLENTGSATRTAGGLINAGPLKGTYFGVNGTVNQFAYGDLVSGLVMHGGDTELSQMGQYNGNSLAADEERYNLFGRVSYELNSGIEVFAQASHAWHLSAANYIHPVQDNIIIRNDNPYLPASLKAQMGQLGLTSFTMGSSDTTFPMAGNNGSRTADRFSVGANGDFEAFGKRVKWDGYYQVGITKAHEQTSLLWNTERLNLATDAVRNSSGTIVCRSTLTNPNNGCVPINRIGVNELSPAAVAYIFDKPYRDEKYTQSVGAINLSTNDIQGWAGPISLAVGVEHRNEKITGFVPEAYKTGWRHGNFLPTFGEYKVTEGYIETVVPLLSGLELNAAGRYTDYSTTGAVQTWKVGMTYQPIEDIKLRVTRSHDIRAPNMSELFSQGSSRSNTVSINGVPTAFRQILLGTTSLEPEVADSLGLGIVFTPRFVPGLAASIDYYDIKINKVITTLTVEQVVQFCFEQHVQKYCDNVIYTNGVVSNINLYYENFNSQQTRGIDFEASYQMDLGPGSLSLRGVATHYLKNITDNGVTAINNVGSVQGGGATPDWLYRLSAIYNMDDWSSALTLRGVSDGVISNAYTECTTGCPVLVAPYYTINDNHVPGAYYLDASISKTFHLNNKDFEVFFRVKNILNRDPGFVSDPASAGGESTLMFPQTNRSIYDVMGRTFRAGVHFTF